MEHLRFLNRALSEFQEGNRSPIDGYQHLPIIPLDEAIRKLIPLVPGIMDYASEAKTYCNKSSMFTNDESAAVYLYSMPIPLTSRLKEDVQTADRHALEPWFAFLKLFMTTLEKLPSTKVTVWRGVECDNSLTFVNNDVHIWWPITSCSMSRDIVEPYVDQNGTLFAIEAIHAKDISALSVFPEEHEVILMPGTRVRSKFQSNIHGDQPRIVHLEEVYTAECH